MSEYAPPLADIEFLLDHVVDLDGLAKLAPFEHADPSSVYPVLAEFGRLMSEEWSPTNPVGDAQGSRLEEDTVRTPDGFRNAYRRYREAGWPSVPFPVEYGGGGFPWLVGLVMQEMANSANMALAMAPLLTQGAIDAILQHGSEEQREVFVTKLVAGEWTGTMNLTEPEAGSDVGALRTRAVAHGDGSYRITGQKIFITFGEHDLTDNIVHLVLARTPDAPPGTKGISLFIVPKLLVNDDGSLGERNDVRVVSIEHKMGIKASPTCVMAFGDEGAGAVGYLVGQENAGMRHMFTMMNNARLSVGIEGLGLAQRAYQRAVAYAAERHQGQAPGAPPGGPSPIIDHPDVRRMLMTMRASVEAMRALCYVTAQHMDLARHHPDASQRSQSQEMVDVLIPLAKSWSTDLAETVTSIGVQVHGGMGYIEETGAAQHYRDAKITQIYEGTNGIQAIDLVGRKLPMRGGGVVHDQLARMRATVSELNGAGPDLAPVHDQLAKAIDAVEHAAGWVREQGEHDRAEALAGATPFQRMFAIAAGGWLLARSALAARALTDGGGAPAGAAYDDEFLAAKIVTARFFAEHLLPEVHALLPAVVAGKGDLFAIAPDAL